MRVQILLEALEKIAEADVRYDVQIIAIKALAEYYNARDQSLQIDRRIIHACKYWQNRWPQELVSGVMFFDGLRITREEFEAYLEGRIDTE